MKPHGHHKVTMCTLPKTLGGIYIYSMEICLMRGKVISFPSTAKYVYKCFQGNAPQYLRQIIVEEKPRRDGLWSSSEHKCLHLPRATRKTQAARSFSVKGPELWNRIPANIRKQKTLKTFKLNLKTYLFNKYLKHWTVYSTAKT